MLAVFASKGSFCRKPPFSTGRNDRLKPGKLLNLIDISGIKQGSFQLHCFDIQGSGFFQRRAFLINSSGRYSDGWTNYLKPRPNAIDFPLDNARHLCRVKCRERLATLYSDVECCQVLSSVLECCRALSSVVESNLIKVKIVERRRSTFLLFEVLSSVVECVWPGARLSARRY